MFATVISQNKNSSSSLLLSCFVSPPNHPPVFPSADIPRSTLRISSRPTQGPPRLTSPTAGPLSFFSGPPGWVGPFNSQNPYEPTRTHHNHPREPKSCDLVNLCLPQMLQDFFVQCEGVIKKTQGKTERTLVIPMRKESHTIPRLSCSSFLLVSAVRRNSCTKLQQFPDVKAWGPFYPTVDGRNPVNNGITYLSTGAGFLPSTLPHVLKYYYKF